MSHQNAPLALAACMTYLNWIGAASAQVTISLPDLRIGEGYSNTWNVFEIDESLLGTEAYNRVTVSYTVEGWSPSTDPSMKGDDISFLFEDIRNQTGGRVHFGSSRTRDAYYLAEAGDRVSVQLDSVLPFTGIDKDLRINFTLSLTPFSSDPAMYLQNVSLTDLELTFEHVETTPHLVIDEFITFDYIHNGTAPFVYNAIPIADLSQVPAGEYTGVEVLYDWEAFYDSEAGGERIEYPVIVANDSSDAQNVFYSRATNTATHEIDQSYVLDAQDIHRATVASRQAFDGVWNPSDAGMGLHLLFMRSIGYEGGDSFPSQISNIRVRFLTAEEFKPDVSGTKLHIDENQMRADGPFDLVVDDHTSADQTVAYNGAVYQYSAHELRVTQSGTYKIGLWTQGGLGDPALRVFGRLSIFTEFDPANPEANAIVLDMPSEADATSTAGDPIAFSVDLDAGVEYQIVYRSPDVHNPPLGGNWFQIWGSGPGTMYSGEAPEEPCPADFDGNGERSVQDLLAYLSAFRARAATADLDGAPGITVQDLLAFLSAFRAGC